MGRQPSQKQPGRFFPLQRLFRRPQPVHQQTISIRRPESGDAGRKRRFAYYVVQFLSLLFSWGQPRGYCDINPAAAAPEIAKPRGAPCATGHGARKRSRR
jgi:hypothetical protein